MGPISPRLRRTLLCWGIFLVCCMIIAMIRRLFPWWPVFLGNYVLAAFLTSLIVPRTPFLVRLGLLFLVVGGVGLSLLGRLTMRWSWPEQSWATALLVVVFAVIGTLMLLGVGLVAGGWMSLVATDNVDKRDLVQQRRQQWGKIASLLIMFVGLEIAGLSPFMDRPTAFVFVFPVLLFVLGLLATASAAGELAEPAARRALIKRQAGRYLYKALLMYAVLWLADHARTGLMVGCIVLAFVPDVSFWLVKRRMALGSRRERILGILDRFVIIQE